jgi:thymidylate synthase
VILDENHKRIKEVVTNKPLFEIEEIAKSLIDETEGANSAYWSKILGNTIWNNWKPKSFIPPLASS